MENLTRQSINRRLTITLFLTTVGSLVIALGVVGIRETVRNKDSILSRSETLAELTGINTAVALSFLDPMSAAQTLSALSAAKSVVAAVIYDESGEEFARYTREDTAFDTPAVAAAGHDFTSDHLDLRRPILFSGAEIGTILIRWDVSEIDDRIMAMLGLAAILAGAAAAIAGLISIWLRGRISNPLAKLVDGTQAIADGDLSTHVEIDSGDEIGLLARTFNSMAESLRQLVSQVNHSVNDVGEVARMLEERGSGLAQNAERQDAATLDTTEAVDQVGESIRGVNEDVENLAESMRETSSSIAEMQASIAEVAGHMDHLSGSIETTSAAVNQVAANTNEVVQGVETLNQATGDSTFRLEQLSSSVKRVKANAQASHELSADASQEASRGLEAVQQTITAMGEISSSFHEFESRLRRLSEKSDSIDAILKVIRSVVERTSMLSLNASIIAAQAGEHGKAFSVVAEEVNNLAQSTERSTHEIAELIQAVHEDTAAAVMAAEEGASKVEVGVQRSNVAGTVLQVISEKSRHSAERVRDILEASSAQGEDLSSVEQAMNAVNQIVESFGNSARDQQNATTDIASAIETIRMLGLDVRRSTDEQRHGSVLIMNAVTEVSGLISHISEATKDQTKSAENIQHALEVFREVTSDTNSSVEAINQMVAMLSERAVKLEAEIGRFRTE
ncbi:MAG: HAMP domain-containing protein [Myxococcales bacterium]|nr:HAMP domain-containing protein [Myxococcales bacterium]